MTLDQISYSMIATKIPRVNRADNKANAARQGDYESNSFLQYAIQFFGNQPRWYLPSLL